MTSVKERMKGSCLIKPSKCPLSFILNKNKSRQGTKILRLIETLLRKVLMTEQQKNLADLKEALFVHTINSLMVRLASITRIYLKIRNRLSESIFSKIQWHKKVQILRQCRQKLRIARHRELRCHHKWQSIIMMHKDVIRLLLES